MKLPFCPPCNQFNKDLNNLQFKHPNKSHPPPSPLRLLEEWKVTSHWNSPRNSFISLPLLTRLHIEFKWVKEKEQWLHTSTICEKWRRVPRPRQNTRSYTWLQKLTHIMSKRAKIKHYPYEISHPFSLHNRIPSTSHYGFYVEGNQWQEKVRHPSRTNTTFSLIIFKTSRLT